MEGISLIETKSHQELVAKVEALYGLVETIGSELHEAKKPYLTSYEVADMLGFSRDWITDNKQHIGYTIVGGGLRFKRKDVEAYMEQNYFKTKRRK